MAACLILYHMQQEYCEKFAKSCNKLIEIC